MRPFNWRQFQNISDSQVSTGATTGFQQQLIGLTSSKWLGKRMGIFPQKVGPRKCAEIIWSIWS